VSGDTLEVQVVNIEHPDHAPAVQGVVCTAEGYSYLFTLMLAAPFAGRTVQDRASGPLWMPPSDRVAELPSIPAGWRLTSVNTSGEVLWRDWRPGPDAPGAADRDLALFQAFNGPPLHTIDAPVATASIRGQDVPIGRNGEAGYMVSWMLETDGMSLLTSASELTLDDFVAMANAVAVPGE
jgi:hypothetical protein